jgi:hypothetical protein
MFGWLPTLDFDFVDLWKGLLNWKVIMVVASITVVELLIALLFIRCNPVLRGYRLIARTIITFVLLGGSTPALTSTASQSDHEVRWLTEGTPPTHSAHEYKSNAQPANITSVENSNAMMYVRLPLFLSSDSEYLGAQFRNETDRLMISEWVERMAYSGRIEIVRNTGTRRATSIPRG